MESEAHNPQAAVLLGPTGSGKTPLGDWLEVHGLRGRRCCHFDFGTQLRHTAGGSEPPDGLGPDDIAFVRHALATGALLDDEHFPIAEAVLRGFLAERQVERDALVVLNGLPRHIGQARGLDAVVEVIAVVELCCTPECALARVRANAGGDRSERIDDDAEAVRRRLNVYDRYTRPLIDFYRRRGAAILTLETRDDTDAASAALHLERLMGSE